LLLLVYTTIINLTKLSKSRIVSVHPKPRGIRRGRETDRRRGISQSVGIMLLCYGRNKFWQMNVIKNNVLYISR
jgi:hypothetical protein